MEMCRGRKISQPAPFEFVVSKQTISFAARIESNRIEERTARAGMIMVRAAMVMASGVRGRFGPEGQSRGIYSPCNAVDRAASRLHVYYTRSPLPRMRTRFKTRTCRRLAQRAPQRVVGAGAW